MAGDGEVCTMEGLFSLSEALVADVYPFFSVLQQVFNVIDIYIFIVAECRIGCWNSVHASSSLFY